MAKRFILLILIVSGWCSAEDQSVRFKLQQGYLIVTQCSVGNLPLTAILDTGASQTVLDSRVAEKLLLPTKTDSATFVSREVGVLSLEVPSVTLGPIQSGPLRVISTDLSGFSSLAGVPVDMVLGIDLLWNSDFLIDYEAQVLRFAPITPLQHHASLEIRSGLATVSMAGLGLPLRLVVDTGFSQLLLFKGRVSLRVRTHEATLKLATAKKTENLQEFDSPPIRVGDWQSSHQRLLLVDDTGEEQTEFDGLLGPRFLGARRIGFDFTKQTLWWE